MANNRKKKIVKNTIIPSLSSEKPSIVDGKMSKEEIEILNNKVFDAVNNLELQKSMDKWLKENKISKEKSLNKSLFLENAMKDFIEKTKKEK